MGATCCCGPNAAVIALDLNADDVEGSPQAMQKLGGLDQENVKGSVGIQPVVQANARDDVPRPEDAANEKLPVMQAPSVETADSAQSDQPGRPSAKPAHNSSLATSNAVAQRAKGAPFPKRPLLSNLSVQVWSKAEELFHLMDPDGSNAVSREEAMNFFKGAFGKVSMEAMFNEIDSDRSGAITGEEFMNFWSQVKRSGYKEKDILEEMDELMQGGAWVDWKDGRDTGHAQKASFPRRPWLCKLSAGNWKKCEDLFNKMDSDKKQHINRNDAEKFFKGGFTKVSAEAMFNEVDTHHHGSITADAWMKFWVQVRGSGYKDKDICEELDNLMEGGAWVDWKDGRTT